MLHSDGDLSGLGVLRLLFGHGSAIDPVADHPAADRARRHPQALGYLGLSERFLPIELSQDLVHGLAEALFDRSNLSGTRRKDLSSNGHAVIMRFQLAKSRVLENAQKVGVGFLPWQEDR